MMAGGVLGFELLGEPAQGEESRDADGEGDDDADQVAVLAQIGQHLDSHGGEDDAGREVLDAAGDLGRDRGNPSDGRSGDRSGDREAD